MGERKEIWIYSFFNKKKNAEWVMGEDPKTGETVATAPNLTQLHKGLDARFPAWTGYVPTE